MAVTRIIKMCGRHNKNWHSKYFAQKFQLFPSISGLDNMEDEIIPHHNDTKPGRKQGKVY